MFNIDLDYILLNLLLLWGFAHYGNKIAKGENFWYNALPCIILFTIIQGCRYLRGNDYIHYTNIFKGDIPETTGILFLATNKIAKFIGFNEYSIFIVYAFFFIYCSMFLLKQYRQYAKWAFPLFIISFMYFEEYMIRQAYSFSFFFLYLHSLFNIQSINIKNIILKNKKNILYCLVWATICINIHSANIINILIITFLYLFIRKPLHYNITIPIYIVCVYVLPKIFNYTYLQPILNLFADKNELANTYIENADYWFSAEGHNNIYTRNVIIQIFEVFGVSSLLYLGYKTVLSIPKLKFINSTMLNIFFIGISFQSLFRNLEILNRIGYIMNLFWCFILAVVLYYKPNKLSKIDTIAYFCLIWFIYTFIRYLITPGKMVLFIWDAPNIVHFF